MSKAKEISATEKLLEMIRSDNAADQSNASGLGLDASPSSGLSLESSTSPEIVSEAEKIIPAGRATAEVNLPGNAPIIDQSDEQPLVPKNKIHTPPETPDKQRTSLANKPPPAGGGQQKAKATIDKALSLFKEKAPSLSKVTSTKIGIDLHEKSISFAVLPSGPGALHKENFFSVTIPPLEGETPRFEDPEFIQFFKNQIDKICKNSAKAEIWCSPNSQNAEILTIIIPKVPKKEIANAVFWSTKKETEYDMAKYVFDFSIRQEITEGNLKKIITTVYLLPILQLNDLKILFRKAGVNLTGVTLTSSAIESIARNGFLPDNQETSVHLSFVRDEALIDMYHNGTMLFTRKIKTGINSIVESIFDKAAEQDLFLDDQSAINLLFSNTRSSFYQDPKSDDQELSELTKLLTPEDLPVTNRLSRQLSRTFDYCSTHFKIPRASCLLTSGPFVLKKTILNQLESELNIDCSIINLCSNDQNKPSTLTADIPDEINPIPAFGLAMSDKNVTQNFLYTFADKKHFIKETRMNQGIALVTIILALLCGAFFFVQHQTLKGKREIAGQLQAKLEAQYLLDTRSRDATFSQMASKKIATILRQNNQTAQRFQIMAAISLLLENIPADIKLTDLFIAPTPEKEARKTKKKKATGAQNSNFLRMKGIVSSLPEKQNFILLDFQKKLFNLPMIDTADIDKNQTTNHEDNDLLYFTINMRTSRDIL